MVLTDLIAKLKIDAEDDSLGFNKAKRCFEYAVVQVNQDLSTVYAISGTLEADTEILPDPQARDQELLLILARFHLADMKRRAAASALSWKSGDKSVDRSRMALSYSELTRDLWKQYLRLAGLPEDYIPLSMGASFESVGGDVDWSATRQATWAGK